MQRAKRLTLIRATVTLPARSILKQYFAIKWNGERGARVYVVAQAASWISLIFVNPQPTVAVGLHVALWFSSAILADLSTK